MGDPTENLPSAIREKVRHILQEQVRGGSQRFQASGDRSGSEGQRQISKLIRNAGISRNDPRWTDVIEFGRQLYYEQPDGRQRPAVKRNPNGAAAIDPFEDFAASERRLRRIKTKLEILVAAVSLIGGIIAILHAMRR